ncbi:MAG: histidinol-phosphate aminotransferase family protein [Candidatus Methanospirare jalkutatii]|nr:histidinol-phosphate aminotransferase family protein [Candidatus Methanospirare jalkutatii]
MFKRLPARCEHGGSLPTRENACGVRGHREILDFSANLNPYGPPDFLSDAIEEAEQEIGKYPDSDASELRELLAAKFKRSSDEIIVAAGISELIYLVLLAFSPRRVIVLEHTYCEYERVANIFGIPVKKVGMPELQIKAEKIAEAMKSEDLAFLCNPNNPTGQYLGRDAIEMLLDAAERVSAMLVVDEAYVDFVQNAFPSHKICSQNMLIFRSFTKSFGIPGVRIGFAIGSSDAIEALNAVKPPWNVSIFAQKIGTAALRNESFLRETIPKVWRQKRRIERELGVRSDANFFLLNTAPFGKNAREVKAALLRRGILVRDCTSFMLRTHIRFCVRKEEENERLISALLELRHGF